jgi:hypothetical protein
MATLSISAMSDIEVHAGNQRSVEYDGKIDVSRKSDLLILRCSINCVRQFGVHSVDLGVGIANPGCRIRRRAVHKLPVGPRIHARQVH